MEENVMRPVSLIIAFISILSFITPVLGASPRACMRYAQEAVAQLRQAQSLGLPTPSPVWSSNYQQHYDWCLGQTEQALSQGRALRQAPIDKAKASSRPVVSTPAMTGAIIKTAPVQMQHQGKVATAIRQNNSHACNRYAAESVRQNQVNRRLGAGFTGSAWSGDSQAHQRWCLQGNNVQTTPGHLQRREKMLQAFAIKNGKDAARRYAEESVRQNAANKAMKAGYPPPIWSSDFNAHYQWSKVGNNLAATPGHLASRERMLQEAAIKQKHGSTSAAQAVKTAGKNVHKLARPVQSQSKYPVQGAVTATAQSIAFERRSSSRSGVGQVFIPLLMHYMARHFDGVKNPGQIDHKITKLLRKDPETRGFYLRLLQKYRAMPMAKKKLMFDPQIVQLSASRNNTITQSDIEHAYHRAISVSSLSGQASKNPLPPKTPTRLVSVNDSARSRIEQGGGGTYNPLGMYLQWRWDWPTKAQGFAIYRSKSLHDAPQFVAEVSAGTRSFRDDALPEPVGKNDAYCYEVRAFVRPVVGVIWHNRIESAPSNRSCSRYGLNLPPAADTDQDGFSDPFDWCPNDGQAKNIRRINGCPDLDSDGFADAVKDKAIPVKFRDSCPPGSSNDGYERRGFEWDYLRSFDPLPGCPIKYELRWMGLEILNDPLECADPNDPYEISCASEVGLGNESGQRNEVINGVKLPPGYEPYLVFGLLNGISPQGKAQKWTRKWCCGEGVNVGGIKVKNVFTATAKMGGIEPDNDFRGAEDPAVDQEVRQRGMILLPEVSKQYVTIDGLGLTLTSTLYERDFDTLSTPASNEVKIMDFLTLGAGMMKSIFGCGFTGGAGCAKSLGEGLVSLITFGLSANKKPDNIIVRDQDDVMGVASTGFDRWRASSATESSGAYGFYQQVPFATYYTSYNPHISPPQLVTKRSVATMIGRAKFCLIRKGIDESRVKQLCEPYASPLQWLHVLY